MVSGEALASWPFGSLAMALSAASGGLARERIQNKIEVSATDGTTPRAKRQNGNSNLLNVETVQRYRWRALSYRPCFKHQGGEE